MEVDDPVPDPDVNLEEDEVMEEEENVKPEAPAPRPKPTPTQLSSYYAVDFPVEMLQRWLGYGKDTLFRRREFVFQRTLCAQDAATMARYKSFDNAAELRKGIIKFEPDRIELGAVFTHQPKMKERAVGKFEPVERELIFDIDASDYDDIRVCCKDKKMCDHCWAFMTSGVRALDDLIRKDFGFKHAMWVFSGRRGVHCWVSDKKARMLTNEQRAAVAQYIQVHEGGKSVEESKLYIEKDLANNSLHPSQKRVYDEVLYPAFQNIVLNTDNPNNLSNPKVAETILALVKARVYTASTVAKVEDLLARVTGGNLTPLQGWAAIKKVKPDVVSGGKAAGYKAHMMEWVTQIIEILYTAPRLDVNVSTKRNHLLKSPYSIHPGTGMVCVPFLPSELDDFKPFKDAPHLADVAPKMRLPRMDIFEDYVKGLEAERTGVDAPMQDDTAA